MIISTLATHWLAGFWTSYFSPYLHCPLCKKCLWLKEFSWWTFELNNLPLWHKKGSGDEGHQLCLLEQQGPRILNTSPWAILNLFLDWNPGRRYSCGPTPVFGIRSSIVSESFLEDKVWLSSLTSLPPTVFTICVAFWVGNLMSIVSFNDSEWQLGSVSPLLCIPRLLEMPKRAGMTTPADLENTWTYSLTFRYVEVPVTGSWGPLNLPATETQPKAP